MVLIMAEKKVTLIIEGMHCGHCAETIANGLKNAKGVRSAEVVYTTGKARVVYDDSAASVEDLVRMVKDLGYEVKTVKE
jgi:copper chaperone